MDIHEDLDEITRENNQSEANFMNYYSTSPTTSVGQNKNDAEGRLVKAVFEEEPPANMRKSNFFHFILSFYDEKDHIIEVEKGLFFGFPNEDEKMKDLRNGLVYRLHLKFQDGHSYTEEILITLIDSQTEQIIRYEGIDKNPDMRRVLLTHEKMCSRCQRKKSCGNKNETPSDCIILGKDKVKFFMKCNQNCLKTAGNPREIRRFQLVISTMANMFHPLAKSNPIFVHNNSKHGRRPTSGPAGTKTHLLPSIKCLIPADGWVTGGSQVVIIGSNFEDGIQILLGNVLIWIVEVLSKNTLRFVLPPRTEAGNVEVFLSYKSKPVYQRPTVMFTYNALNEPSIDFEFQRLSKFIPRHPGDSENISKVTILKRTSDIMETLFNMQPVQIMVPTVPPTSRVCSNFHGYMTPNPSYHPCYLGSVEDYTRPTPLQSKTGFTTAASTLNTDDHITRSNNLQSKPSLSSYVSSSLVNDSTNLLQTQSNRNETCSTAMVQRAHGYNNGSNNSNNSNTSEPRCSTQGQHFCSDICCTSINLYSTQPSFTNSCIYSTTQRNDLDLYNNHIYSDDSHRSTTAGSNIYSSIKSRASNLNFNQSINASRTPQQISQPSSGNYNNNSNTTTNPPYCVDSMYTNVLPYTRDTHSINNIVYKSVLRPTHTKSSTPITSLGEEAPSSKRVKLENKEKCLWGSSPQISNNNTPGITPMNTPTLSPSVPFPSAASSAPLSPTAHNSFMNDVSATPSSYGGEMMSSYNSNTCTPHQTQQQQQQQCNRQLAYGMEKY